MKNGKRYLFDDDQTPPTETEIMLWEEETKRMWERQACSTKLSPSHPLGIHIRVCMEYYGIPELTPEIFIIPSKISTHDEVASLNNTRLFKEVDGETKWDRIIYWIEISESWWKKLPYNTWKVILSHECAHLYLEEYIAEYQSEENWQEGKEYVSEREKELICHLHAAFFTSGEEVKRALELTRVPGDGELAFMKACWPSVERQRFLSSLTGCVLRRIRRRRK